MLKVKQAEGAKKQQERQSSILQSKKKQAEIAKDGARLKEQQRKTKNDSALLIQKQWRGHNERKDFVEMKKGLVAIKTLRHSLFDKLMGTTKSTIMA